MRSDTVVPVEDPWLSSQQQEQEQQQQQDFAVLRSRALSLAKVLSSSPLPSSSSLPSLATDVEVLASQVAALPPVGEEETLMAEEGWLVAAVADLRARLRSLSSNGGGEAAAAAATATAATTLKAAAFGSALSQRFERTTLKFFMPGSSSACVASRRLRLELGKMMALAG